MENKTQKKGESETPFQYTNRIKSSYNLIRIELTDFPPDLVTALNYNATNGVNLTFSMNNFGQIIHYNVVDCECVLELLKKFDYTALFEQFVLTYQGPIETALNATVSIRIQYCFNYKAVNYNELISWRIINNSRYGDKLLARYLFPQNFNLKELEISDILHR